MLIFANVRLIKIIGVTITVLLIIPFLIHHYLTLVGSESRSTGIQGPDGSDGGVSSSFIIQLTNNLDQLQGADLKYRIEELIRIKTSVLLELHSLEAKRRTIQLDIASFTKKLDDYKIEASHKKNELDRLQISVEQAKVAEKEAMERNTPRLGRPKGLGEFKYREYLSAPQQQQQSFTLAGGSGPTNKQCNMDTCFDFSLCPISNQFRFYVYLPSNSQENTKSQEFGNGNNNNDNDIHNNQPSTSSNTQILYGLLQENIYYSSNPYKACIFIVLIDSCSSVDSLKSLQSILQHWNGDGRNHIIWFTTTCSIINFDYLPYTGRALVITQNVDKNFRYGFDLLSSYLPILPKERVNLGTEILQLPSITPAKRKYLATYLGGKVDQVLQAELLKIQQEDPLSFVFQFSCATMLVTTETQEESRNNDATKKLSDLCNNDLLRTRLLIDSTFVLIILPQSSSSTTATDRRKEALSFTLRIYEALKYGSIPAVLGTNLQQYFPYSEVLDWHKTIINFPWARITELHYLLKYVSDADLLAFRKNGRSIYEKYLSSTPSVINTILAVLRTRLGLPSIPYPTIHWSNVFNDSFIPLKLETLQLDPEDEENLGPIEPPYPSAPYLRNFSGFNLEKYDSWNGPISPPFYLLPYSPWDKNSIMPSEAKFKGSSIGFRPIGNGNGGAGKEFSEALGGNLPKEQFTIVMLTYERESVLINSLSRLYLLPYLNKVIVVWNSEKPPSSDLKWPEIGVPIKIVKAAKNSLNNRFLPFDAIETEAILSIDDDAHLRHDEIVFGFRVWRENRDRIVGFPGRFHAWDSLHSNWLYNSNYSCELSMVLTGAAFYHKLYSYLYTYEMPSIIRDKVDELINCEDIAMNFLVSHVTQKPPIKVTSRWTFRCPGCPVTLSEDETHFQERHACINYFSQVYGYTPLLYTQFRADSILFKTRIPHDKQKCFKYI